MKKREQQLVTYLYKIPGWSPLEIASELGLTFRQVCRFIDGNCLRKMDIAVAVNVKKATRADYYEPLSLGFDNPFSRRTPLRIAKA